MRVFRLNGVLYDDDDDDDDEEELTRNIITTPVKKQLFVIDNSDFITCEKKSLLEALPQEILIRIVCGVEHDDLKRLFHVSKLIREATVIAKELHFAYITPKRALHIQNSFNSEDSSCFNVVEAPKAPKPIRVLHSRLSKKQLTDISVALFATPNEKAWRRKTKCSCKLV